MASFSKRAAKVELFDLGHTICGWLHGCLATAFWWCGGRGKLCFRDGRRIGGSSYWEWTLLQGAWVKTTAVIRTGQAPWLTILFLGTEVTNVVTVSLSYGCHVRGQVENGAKEWGTRQLWCELRARNCQPQRSPPRDWERKYLRWLMVVDGSWPFVEIIYAHFKRPFGIATLNPVEEKSRQKLFDHHRIPWSSVKETLV